jgi:ADP-heptose:LPS heptosyltransferase
MHLPSIDPSNSFPTRVMRVLRYGRSVAFTVLDTLVKLLVVRKNRESSIIVRLDAIGDFFLWMQSGAAEITAFAKSHGNATILLANSSWADYARHLGLWDEIIAIDPRKLARNPWYRWHRMTQVRRLGADLFIQPRSSWVPSQEDALAGVSGAKTRIGNAGALINLTPASRERGNRKFNRLIQVNVDQRTHETHRNAEFVAKLLARNVIPFDFSRVHECCERDFVVVALGAGQTGRIWPVRKLAKLLQHVERKQPGTAFKLLGSSRESELAKQLEDLVAVPTENLVGKTALLSFVDMIAASRLVISNDSSAFHVAMALQKDVICFLGGGHFGWFAPYPPDANRRSRVRVLYEELECYWCNWSCRFPRSTDGSFKCLDAISVEVATRAVDSLLREDRRPKH